MHACGVLGVAVSGPLSCISKMSTSGNVITSACFPMFEYDIENCKSIELRHCETSVDENVLHQLGFGGLPTNRNPVHTLCTSKSDGIGMLHPLLKTVVVGHTPQPTGLVTIVSEQAGSHCTQKYAIFTDTQFAPGGRF